MREKLGIQDELVLFHASNLRSVKRVDLLLQTIARCKRRDRIKLVILAGASFKEHEGLVAELGIGDSVIVRENGYPIESYIGASDLGIYTSESESFCLGILESMFLGRASLAFRVGGIPEVIEDGVTGQLFEFGEVDRLAQTIDELAESPTQVETMGIAARQRAEGLFTADVVVPQYLALYRKALRGSGLTG